MGWDFQDYQTLGRIAKALESIAQSLGSTQRATPQTEVRGDDPEPYGFHSRIAACLRSCAQTIMENRMDGPTAVGYLAKYADTVQPTSGPPTPNLADQLDPNTKFHPFDLEQLRAEAYQAINQMERFRIGVHDYNSLVGCLLANYELVFPGENWVDPQNMIQIMAAHIQELRRLLEGPKIVEKKNV